jgi:hypothetical protein
LRIAVISSFSASIIASEEEDDDGVFVFSASNNDDDEVGEETEEASVAFRVKRLKSLPPSPVNADDDNDAFARYDSASKKEGEDEEVIGLSFSLCPCVCV